MQWRGVRPPPLPWPPLLSPAQLRRGLGFYGSGQRIERVVAALMGGAPITAVAVGGSIARGAGSSREEWAFPARFFAFLNATWPHRWAASWAGLCWVAVGEPRRTVRQPERTLSGLDPAAPCPLLFPSCHKQGPHVP